MIRSCPSIVLLLLLITSCGRAVGFSVAPTGPAPLPPGGAPCGSHCRCHERVLSCVGSSDVLLEKIPVVKSPNTTFNILDFKNNRIASIEKGAWYSYPWTETLILKNNLLEEIHVDAFEGLQLLKVLDLSCNKINRIDPRVFHPVSFLCNLDLSGNSITNIQIGTFQTWHHLQFLTYVTLAQNPLEDFADRSLFHVKSLEHLDLGSSRIPFPAVEALMMFPPQLKKVVLPLHVVCCLCLAEMDTGKLSGSVDLHCAKICYGNTLQCGPHGNSFEDKVFRHSLAEHRRHATDTLRVEPETSSLACEEKNIEPDVTAEENSPKSHRRSRTQPRTRDNPGFFRRHLVKEISIGIASLVIGGISLLLRKVCFKSETKEPPEIIRMEEGRSGATEADQ